VEYKNSRILQFYNKSLYFENGAEYSHSYYCYAICRTTRSPMTFGNFYLIYVEPGTSGQYRD